MLERAVVVAVDDSQERARYRVRILRLHDEAIPAEHLPWAEMLTAAGREWGDVPHYEIDDLVWVDFEGGDREKPVLMGGWIAAPKGVSDLPSEQTGDYPNDRRRWVRKDRAGNLVEVSEKDDELHVKLKSGEVEMVITQRDNSFTVTASGPATIDVQGPATVKSAGVVKVDAGGDVEILAGGKIKLGDGSLGDIVTTLHPCAFTGGMHPAGSSIAQAKQ